MNDAQTIYIGRDEDITSVIDHLTSAETDKINLIIPEGAEIFSSVVNLRLLKREADLQGKKITLVSSDKIGEYLAEKASVPFEKKIEAQEGKRKLPLKPKRPFLRASETPASFMEKPLSKAEVVSSLGKSIPVRKMADIVFPQKIFQGKTQDDFSQPTLKEKEAINEKMRHFKPEAVVYNAKEDTELESPNAEFAPEKDFAAKEKNTYLDYENQIYSTPYAPPTTPPIEDYSGSMDYQRAESGYLAKYLQQTAYPAESSSSHQFSSKEENKRSHSRVGVGGLKKIITILAVIGAATFLVAAYFILPKADLIVVPKKDSASFNIQVIADKNLNKVDYSLKKIPAQLIRIEKKGSKEFTATGKSSGSVKARGKILIYNAYSASPQTLVQNTRFVSNDTGKVFRITKNITVPGAKMEKGKLTPSSIETEVIADQAGSDYNIGPGKFSIPGFQGTPKYDGFYGVSNLTMSGGAQGEAIIVSSDDQKTARENLSEQIKIDINKAISEQISSNFKLLDGALKQGEPLISFSKQVGEAAEKFNASFSIDMTALVFDEKVINDLIDKIVIASSADKKETLSLSRKIDYQNTKINLEIGQIHMDISVQEEFTHKIDIAGLKKSLVGKNEGEIKLVLGQMPEILNLKVSLWPFWVRSIPAQADKINIIIE